MKQTNGFIARSVDLLFHPLCAPVYIAAIYLWFNRLITLDTDVSLFFLIYIAVTVVVIPAACFGLLLLSKIYSPRKSNTKRWLTFFVISIAFIFLAVSKSLVKVGAPWLLVDFFIWNVWFLLIYAVISFFVRLNYHAIAIGEMLGLYINFMHFGMSFNHLLLLALILIFGLVGFSQMKMNKCSSSIYYLSSILGLLSSFATFYYEIII